MQEETYKTSKFDLAIFLLTKNIPLLRTEEVTYNQKNFIFDNNVTTQYFVDCYKFGKNTSKEKELVVNVRDYEESRNILLDLLKA